MKKKYSLILLFLILLNYKNFANHIVGGEIYYDCLGGNNYKITLKIYRDCNGSGAPYDNLAYVFIFNGNGTFLDSVAIPFPGSVTLPSTINNPCFTPPTNICVEEAVYRTVISLPPIPGGYNISYQRCCRNMTILNIMNPNTVGSTYMAHIPDNSLAICNSSPHYSNFPPIFICQGVPLIFNHSATDPDGDSLYYDFCDPYIGLNNCCCSLGPWSGGYCTGGCSMTCPEVGSPPPFLFVPWQSPYNASYPMSSSPAMAIDHATGLLTGTPNMLGQWVLGVCVSEFRNGVLLSVNKRDFQFNVVNCPNLPVASIPGQQVFCFGNQVQFSQSSINASSYHWDFGDPNTTLDVSTIASPIWTYADSGTYTVTLIINPGTLCADTNTSSFYIYPLLAPTFIAPPGECVYSNNFSFSAAGAFAGNGTFNWSFGPHASPAISGVQNPANIVFDSAAIYPLTLTVNENGCSVSFTADVVVYAKPIANFGLTTEMGCLLNLVYFLDSSVTDTPLSYDWDFGNGTNSSIQNPTMAYTSVGNYTVNLFITTQHGCKDTIDAPTLLSVYEPPVAGIVATPTDTSIFYPEINVMDLSSGASTCTVFWGDGTSTLSCDSTHSYTQPGTYTIMQVVKNDYGCFDTATVEIHIHPEYLFWLPNAFTPNNNGLNDIFKPKMIGVHDYKFLIFDRWGEQIFETNNVEEGWNGSYKNKLCSNDVYVYKIVFRDDVEKNFHQYIGRVTLVR